MVTVLNLYTIYTAKRRSLPFWNKFGPSILVVTSSVLIMLEPTRHLWKDDHVFSADQMVEYKENCNGEWWICLSAVGWLFTVGATYIGFILLMWGSFWNANLISKLKEIRDRWRQIRARHKTNGLLQEHDDKNLNSSTAETV